MGAFRLARPTHHYVLTDKVMGSIFFSTSASFLEKLLTFVAGPSALHDDDLSLLRWTATEI